MQAFTREISLCCCQRILVGNRWAWKRRVKVQKERPQVPSPGQFWAVDWACLRGLELWRYRALVPLSLPGQSWQHLLAQGSAAQSGVSQERWLVSESPSMKQNVTKVICKRMVFCFQCIAIRPTKLASRRKSSKTQVLRQSGKPASLPSTVTMPQNARRGLVRHPPKSQTEETPKKQSEATASQA